MKLLIFDGNSILNRAYYAIRTLNAKDGRPTNGIFGFLKLYHKYFELSKPDMVAVSFDLKGPTFRHEMYAEYKAQRKGMPEDLAAQMEPLKEILRAMNITILEKQGYEADDVIGTVSRFCKERGIECDIVSGDRDDFQLVGEGVRLLLPVTKVGGSEVELYDEAALWEKFSLKPHQMIDLKSIQGDTSDNIKGVPGIGAKGALELIQKYGSLDGVYENIEELRPALQNKLIEGKESAYLSYDLAKICCEVPLELNEKAMAIVPFDEQALYALLEDLDLTSLISLFGLSKQKSAFISDRLEGKAEDYLDYFKQEGLFFLKTAEGFFAHFEGKVLALCDGEALPSKIEASCTFDAKPYYGKDYAGEPYFDLMVAAYVADPSDKYELISLCEKYLGLYPASLEDCVALMPQLKEAILKVISEQGQEALLYEVEFPLTIVLADMEARGFGVDQARLEEYTAALGTHIETLEQEIHALAGEKFNLNSPKQLGEILFGKMGLKGGKKTKTGYSTNADVLEKLRGEPLVDKILEYRKYAKLRSTYGEGLLKLIEEDGRIHSNYNQTVTLTGRISSSEPNLQNIPVRDELGRELRKMFVAEKGKILLDADYSQIELRVLAHIAGDKTMIAAFREHEDIHTVTAATVFGVPAFMVTPEMRRHAKAVNFGIVYGISDFSLAGDIGVSKKEAKAYIDQYLAQYSGVRDYMSSIVERARADGYVTTLFGRRRYLPELSSSNFIQRSFGERVALNTPIQGTAADIIKIAMVRVAKSLREEKLDARIILQVHDELILESSLADAEAAALVLRREMEGAAKLSVAMEAEVNMGASWYECK